jgi:pimeloyl-ACP methyl ester carboxylesterase
MTVASRDFTRTQVGSLSCMHNGMVGGTPVVFLHGFSDMGECWNAFVDRLQLEVPIYLVDAPAHGYSALDSTRGYSEQLVARTIEFIRGLQQPVVLMGHSMGALEAMYIAGDAPELIRAIVLEDPPMAPDLTPWRDPATLEGLFNFLISFHHQDPVSAEAQILASQPDWPAAEFEPWVRSKQLADPAMRARFDIHREPMETTLARIACPALLLTGDPAAHAIVTPETAMWARTLCPTLQVSQFAGSGHSIRRDAADAVATTVRAWMQVFL